LAPYVVKALGDGMLELEAASSSRLRDASFEAARQSLWAMRCSRKPLGALRDRGIDFVIIKGPAVAELCRDVTQRFFADIDILVPPTQFAIALEILRDAGFTAPDRAQPPWPSFSTMTRESVNLHSSEGGNIDVHHHIPPWALSTRLHARDVISRSHAHTSEQGTIYYAAAEESIVIAALHVLNDLWKQKSGLQSWRDILLLGQLLGPERTIDSFKEYGCESLLHAIIRALRPVVPDSAIASGIATIYPTPRRSRLRLDLLGWSHASALTRVPLAWPARLPLARGLLFLVGSAVPSPAYVTQADGGYLHYWKRCLRETLGSAFGGASNNPVHGPFAAQPHDINTPGKTPFTVAARYFDESLAPYCITEAELSDSDPFGRALRDIAKRAYGGALLLLRQHGVPAADISISWDQHRDPTFIRRSLELQSRDAAHRLDPQGHDADHASAAHLDLCVVVCTHNRPDGLRHCLESLCTQTDPEFTVLVIDNAPSSDATERTVERFASQLAIQYLCEPAKGLSRARNLALRTVRADIVAWIDDDELADLTWAEQIRSAFSTSPELTAVLGRLLPARLETTAEVLFERFGGHNKGRHSSSATFHRSTLGPRIFYPLPAVGTGGNMALRLSHVQGTAFDIHLGAGSRCGGAEDTLFLSELLERGATLRYEPRVLTWHYHRATTEELRAQLRGYELGLGAYYASLLWRRPARVKALITLMPTALTDLFHPESTRNKGAPPELKRLMQGSRRAILTGARWYLTDRTVDLLRLAFPKSLPTSHRPQDGRPPNNTAATRP
jgi:hypothetical protein